jgi:hypothetical protein
MKSSIATPLIGASLLYATRALAHGTSAGAVHPHAHPHAAGEGWVIAVALVGAALIVGIAIAALKQRLPRR